MQTEVSGPRQFLCQTGLRRRSESYGDCHRETSATAPVLVSTHLAPNIPSSHPELNHYKVNGFNDTRVQL